MRFSAIFALMIAMSGFTHAVDPFDWVDGTQEEHGCWVATGDTSTPCKDWWDHYTQHTLDVYDCAGFCSFAAFYGRVSCRNAPSHKYTKPGPDYAVEDPAIIGVVFSNQPGPGNVPRYREMKCVKHGGCLCVQADAGRRILCKYDPMIAITFTNPRSYITDAGGPACIVQERPR